MSFRPFRISRLLVRRTISASLFFHPFIFQGEIITGYVVNKGRQDPVLIQHRIRLFQSFLKNVKSHPVLSGDHVFHLFVSEGAEWTEAMTSCESRLPESLQKSPANRKGRIPDPLFSKLEAMTAAYKSGIQSIDGGQRQLIKKLKGTTLIGAKSFLTISIG